MPKIGQPIKAKAKVEPKSLVYHGDYFEWLQQNRTRKFKLLFMDPPFNIGQDYAGYDDNKDPMEYRLWIGKTVAALAMHCADDGVICLHGPDDLAEIYLGAMKAYTPAFKRIAWINWHYRFGQCSRKNWIDSRCHCLIYSKGNHTWNPEDVLVESDRASKYGDKRVLETERGGRRVPFNVWGIPSDGEGWGRVQGNNKERCADRPNQLPEKYLERLIRAYTNPGDWVFEPFAGTGTGSVVAKALGRQFVACDVSSEAVDVVEARLRKGAVNVG